ncbi:MAG TPA: TonB-dependent receptor [Candidatus Sulfotelmatobacter sp.]|nr:TonB-dependent receptor [Candidatus Sulfotelmatobacter sp.]
MLNGVVAASDGAPVARAIVSGGGASTRTDANGRFTLGCPAATLDVRVEHGGFRPTRILGVPCTRPLTVRLAAATLTSIGEVSTSADRVPMNLSPESIVVVDRARIDDQGAIQWNQLLDQTPGAVSAHTGTANPADPGAQTSPNLRGTLDYEKTTLIDGHPVANGSHGDYVTTFLTTYLIEDVEIAKGPGADAPLVVNGIGGSINFRTFDPTRTLTTNFDVGYDGYGGTILHGAISNTIGKLGFYLGYVDWTTSGPLDNEPTDITLPNGSTIAGIGTVGGTTSAKTAPGGAYPVPGSIGGPGSPYPKLVACCEDVGSWYDARGELAKLRYGFSSSSSLTVAFLGTHAGFDNDGAQLQQFQTVTAAGVPVDLNPTSHAPENVTEYENEPMFEGEFRTAPSPNDTLIARYYTLDIDRLSGNYADPSPTVPYSGTFFLSGSAPLTNGTSVPVAGPYSVTIPNIYTRTAEEDKLHGGSFEEDHVAGPVTLTLAIDRWSATTDAYSIGTSSSGKPTYTPTIAAGSSQTITSYLLRGAWTLDPRDDLTLANYLTTYADHVPTAFTVSGPVFATETVGHDDPRLGFTHRFTQNAIGRFAMGSTITVPNMGLVSVPNSAPVFTSSSSGSYYTDTRNAGNLLPETAWGYDLGSDVRLHTDAVLSFDAYETTLRNQFVSAVAQTGTLAPPGGGTPVPVYTTINENLAHARFDGLEASYRQDPRVGFGYVAQGALVRSYTYDVSPATYLAAGKLQNQAVIPNINYTSTGTGYNGISNKGIPYADGYGEVHYRAADGKLALLGLTYYGNNNSWNERAFTVGTAALRVPIARAASLQLTIDNLWNTYPGTAILSYQGVAVPVIGAQVGLTNALPYGPRVVRLDLHLGNAR